METIAEVNFCTPLNKFEGEHVASTVFMVTQKVEMVARDIDAFNKRRASEPDQGPGDLFHVKYGLVFSDFCQRWIGFCLSRDATGPYL